MSICACYILSILPTFLKSHLSWIFVVGIVKDVVGDAEEEEDGWVAVAAEEAWEGLAAVEAWEEVAVAVEDEMVGLLVDEEPSPKTIEAVKIIKAIQHNDLIFNDI